MGRPSRIRTLIYDLRVGTFANPSGFEFANNMIPKRLLVLTLLAAQ